MVPCVFAAAGRTIYWVVDQKPKRSNDLQRLANIRQAVSKFNFDEKAKKFLWFATEPTVFNTNPFQTGWVSGDCRDTLLYRIG